MHNIMSKEMVGQLNTSLLILHRGDCYVRLVARFIPAQVVGEETLPSYQWCKNGE